MSHQFTYASIVEITDEQISYLNRCGPFETRDDLAVALGATLRFFGAEVPVKTGLLQISKNLLDQGLTQISTSEIAQSKPMTCAV